MERTSPRLAVAAGGAMSTSLTGAGERTRYAIDPLVITPADTGAPASAHASSLDAVPLGDGPAIIPAGRAFTCASAPAMLHEEHCG